MVEEGQPAPDFTVPMAMGGAYDNIDMFTLADEVGNGPIVLAFYPAAFTGGCTTEMCEFRDSMARFDDLDARVFGVSVDLPFAQNIFINQENLNFPMLSDFNQKLVHEYDLVMPESRGLRGLAERSIFVIDNDGTVVYRWVREGSRNPKFDELIGEVIDVIDGLCR